MRIDSNILNKKAVNNFNNLEARFNETHNNKYDYTKSIFTGSRNKIEIICPEHGSFWQTPYSHVIGTGCALCGQKAAGNSLRGSTNTFLKNAKEKHNNFYSYLKVKYVHSRTKVTITCPVHGDFEQAPHSHLRGHGCNKCALFNNKDIRRSTKEKFILKATAINKDLYDYSKVVYTHTENPVNIICKIHGEFQQTPHDHITKKAGCPSCATYGFKKDKQAILYYLKILKYDKIYYKIGITNKSIKTRFGSDMKYITVLHQVHYKSGQDAYNEEQRILKQFKEFKYIGPPLLKSNGNTELFNCDILNIHKKDSI